MPDNITSEEIIAATRAYYMSLIKAAQNETDVEKKEQLNRCIRDLLRDSKVWLDKNIPSTL